MILKYHPIINWQSLPVGRLGYSLFIKMLIILKILLFSSNNPSHNMCKKAKIQQTMLDNPDPDVFSALQSPRHEPCARQDS